MGKPSDYGMLFRFDDQSESFVHGFEMGQLWQKLENGDDASGTYHSENAETIQRMATLFNTSLSIKSAECDGQMVDGWIEVKEADRG